MKREKEIDDDERIFQEILSWIVGRGPEPVSLSSVVERFGEGVQDLLAKLALSGSLSILNFEDDKEHRKTLLHVPNYARPDT